jgi:hypothetical protein
MKYNINIGFSIFNKAKNNKTFNNFIVLKMTDNDESLCNSIEQKVLQAKECFVYKVPPLKSASGHRAEDWNLETPLFTGLLRVFQADEKLRVAIYSYKDSKSLSSTDDNIQLFGECPIKLKYHGDIAPYVDAVIDSSRYYVIRIKDPNSERFTHLGIGFRERDTAFDFKSSLNDYIKYVNRMEQGRILASGISTTTNTTVDKNEFNFSSDVYEDNNSTQPIKDFSIKEGEKISIKGFKSNKEKISKPNNISTGGGM